MQSWRNMKFGEYLSIQKRIKQVRNIHRFKIWSGHKAYKIIQKYKGAHFVKRYRASNRNSTSDLSLPVTSSLLIMYPMVKVVSGFWFKCKRQQVKTALNLVPVL